MTSASRTSEGQAEKSDGGDARRSALPSYLALVIVMLTWAGNAIVGRAVSGDVPPFTLAFLRWAGALLLMAPCAMRPLRKDAATLRVHWRLMLLLGLCGIACFNGFLYLALHYTSATNAILIQAAIPPMILVANFLLFRMRAAPQQVIGVVLSTAGVVLVVCRADPAVLRHLSFSRGDVLILCGVVGWALYTALLRVRPQLEPLSFLAVTFLVGMLAMLPLAIGEWLAGHTVVWHATTVAALAYVAIVPSLIGYLLYNIAVGKIGAARAGQTVTLMPVFGAFLAAAVLGEPLHGFHFVGVSLIFAGIALSALSVRRTGRAIGEVSR